jgi:hypothetical protein
VEQRGSWETSITPDLAHFIEGQISVFLGTASKDGQPYIQHRGGPPGFLKVLDESTIGFADFTGSRQYISQGNLSDNPKAILFLIDYDARQRVKIWGAARVVEGDPELIARLMPEDSKRDPSRRSSSPSRPGTRTARSTSRFASRPRKWRRCSPSATRASKLWRRSWHASGRPGTRPRGCGFRVRS